MANKQHLIISAVGPDQVGLVQKISGFINEHKANIEDSKMAVFCGEFAIIMLIAGLEADLATIESKQSELATHTGLSVFMRRPSERHYQEAMMPCELIASSLDHPGIVHRLTSALSELAINIESMQTKTYSAPMSATPMFRFEAHLAVPERVNLARLRHLLQAIGEEENIDIELAIGR
ncbi:MAG: ACT domain-containing protein [Acidobacteriota bacterium]